jgi:hypothetical protein
MRPRRLNKTIVHVARSQRRNETAQRPAWAIRLAARTIDRQREYIIARRMLGDQQNRIARESCDAVNQAVERCRTGAVGPESDVRVELAEEGNGLFGDV